MIQIYVRATLRSPRSTFTAVLLRQAYKHRHFGGSGRRKEDPRILDSAGRTITDEFAALREKYGMEKFIHA